MGEILLNRPQFLAASPKDFKYYKLMFIKKDGVSVHKLGNVSRHTYETELICISNEDDENWIGNYAVGFGLFGVKFAKSDCRDALEEEVQQWILDAGSVKY